MIGAGRDKMPAGLRGGVTMSKYSRGRGRPTLLRRSAPSPRFAHALYLAITVGHSLLIGHAEGSTVTATGTNGTVGANGAAGQNGGDGTDGTDATATANVP